MAAPTSFATSYGVTPWSALEHNQHTVYVPDLLRAFRQKSLFYGMVNYGVNLAAMQTGTMVWDYVYDPEINIDTLDNRAIWLPQVYMDSKRIRITALRYGDEFQYHKYDQYITYWRENQVAGLRNIIQNRIAPHMVMSLDRLARNAFLSKTACVFAGSASGFNNVANAEYFDPDFARQVWMTSEFAPDPVQNPILGIVSPAAVYYIKKTAEGEWVDRIKYADPGRLLNYEIGSYENVRFISHPDMVLWNCGTLIAQTTVAAAISRGQGAPDPDVTKVDDVWEVGQPSATHTVTVADSSGFAAGDRVTLHTHRASAGVKGTLNGVIYNHAKNLDITVHSVPDGTHLVFKKPIMVDWYDTDLGGGVYAYVTKARPIHAALFVKGPQCVVSGVLQPPQTYAKDPIDSTNSIYRFAWDAYLKYQLFYPQNFSLYFHGGHVPVNEVPTLIS